MTKPTEPDLYINDAALRPDPHLHISGRLGDPRIEDPLIAWWLLTARADAEAALIKAREYGSLDLQVMGAALAAGQPAQVQEQAIAFYVLGKVARALSAYARHQSASDDTWMDVAVYAMMARRIRESGRWP